MTAFTLTSFLVRYAHLAARHCPTCHGTGRYSDTPTHGYGPEATGGADCHCPRPVEVRGPSADDLVYGLGSDDATARHDAMADLVMAQFGVAV